MRDRWPYPRGFSFRIASCAPVTVGSIAASQCVTITNRVESWAALSQQVEGGPRTVPDLSARIGRVHSKDQCNIITPAPSGESFARECSRRRVADNARTYQRFLRKQTLRPRKMMELHRIGHEDLEKKPYDVRTLTATKSNDVPDDVDYTDYRFEIARLDSFGDWPVPFVDPKKLAAAGFFYVKQDDRVRCFVCSITLSGWVDGDEPMVEHQRWSGRCKFVRNLPCGNVPIGADPSTIPKMPKRLDTCGLYGVKYMPCSGPDNDLESEKANEPGVVNSEMNDDTEITVFWDSDTNANFTAKLGDVLGSKQPTYACYERRLRSFATWPETMCQNKEDLAAAGFFYLSGFFSPSDQTMCFYCGGCLKSWEPMDDPVKEHVKWFPTCKFIKKIIAKKQLEKKDDQCTPPTERMNKFETKILNVTTSVF